ncbi:hypothetical protein MHYP_G00184580 [Metynnis hypsauchen]
MQMSDLHVSFREIHMALVNMNYGPITAQEPACAGIRVGYEKAGRLYNQLLPLLIARQCLCRRNQLTVATSTPGCLLRKTKPVSSYNIPYLSGSRSMFLRGTPLENLDSSGTTARRFLSKDLGGVHLSCFHFIGLRHPSSVSIYTFLSP